MQVLGYVIFAVMMLLVIGGIGVGVWAYDKKNTKKEGAESGPLEAEGASEVAQAVSSEDIEDEATPGGATANLLEGKSTVTKADFDGKLPWEEAIKTSVLDESLFTSHGKFAADVAKYSSGASMASIAEDNRSVGQTNWVGFSRPRYVPVRRGILQQTSEDPKSYYRDRVIRW